MEEMPKKMVQNLMGAMGSSNAPSAPGEGSVSQFLSYGASILKGILEKGGEALSEQGLSAFSSVLILGLNQALNKMGTTEAFQAPRLILSEIIQHLENPQAA